jgi:hypothetical protein
MVRRIRPTSAEVAETAVVLIQAIVAELADAHGSGPCTRKGVGVRVPSMAPALSCSSLIVGFEIRAEILPRILDVPFSLLSRSSIRRRDVLR